MSGLQTIIDKCNGLDINRRNVVGVQFTRNELPRTSLTPTFNPWRFTLDMPASLRYSEARALMETLDNLDRYTPQVVTFSNNPCLSWIFKYQGEFSSGEISGIRVQTYAGNLLTLTNLPAITGPMTATTVLFKQNDLIQIGSYTFPFTSTTDVLRGSGSTVVVTTSRPNIISTPITPGALGITVGNDCDFYVFCPNMPTYKLIPGGATKGASNVTTNNALLEFSDAFLLYEWVATA
jgi:hypothetical protein